MYEVCSILLEHQRDSALGNFRLLGGPVGDDGLAILSLFLDSIAPVFPADVPRFADRAWLYVRLAELGVWWRDIEDLSNRFLFWPGSLRESLEAMLRACEKVIEVRKHWGQDATAEAEEAARTRREIAALPSRTVVGQPEKLTQHAAALFGLIAPRCVPVRWHRDRKPLIGDGSLKYNERALNIVAAILAEWYEPAPTAKSIKARLQARDRRLRQ